MLKLYDLTIEYKHHPLGLDEVQPRFGWKLDSDEQNVVQTAWQITLNSEGCPVWDSGRVETDQSILAEYLGPNLLPRTAYEWTVTVWDNYGETASASSGFETGLLRGADLEGKATWITHDLPAEETACPVYTKTFAVSGPVAKTRLYATALGVYEAEFNGQPVSDTYFAPGWTNYHKRLQYQTYTLDVQEGENTLAVTVGNGWYKGALGFTPVSNNYGDRTALLAAVCITYADGREEWIGTGTDWQVTTGPIRESEIYNGEVQDFTLAPEAPRPAMAFDYGFDTLVGQENEPVRCLQRLEPVREFTTPAGEHVFDFGQNLTGWVETDIDAQPGQTLVLHHAESLDEKGNFYTGNLSFAKATDTWKLAGGPVVVRPHFTWHGFRYLWVEGLREGQSARFTACHLSTDLAQTGSFHCSDKRVDRLQQNIQWSQRDNFLDIPTDCPQRSERLGWTGDVTAFCATAAFNQNIMPFMTKWLRDLASEQNPETGMPQVVPNILSGSQDGAAFWGDVATVLPWTLYRAYGDKRLLAAQYPSMVQWVEFIETRCEETGLWKKGFQYGDWLGLDTEQNGLADERKGATDDYFAANVCFAWSLQILADTAGVLGYAEEERRWRMRRDALIRAFREEYVTPSGRLVSETQTALVLALHFGMVPEEHRPRLIGLLVNNIEAHKTHLTTGFIGTPFACLALSDCGRHDVAGKLLLQEDSPSWLYEVKMGATTIWERWNSILPDGSFNPANMNSLNHYSYGSIGSWLYTRLCGLEIVEPGYKVFAVKPRFIKGITWAKLEYESVYGKIALAWRCEGGKITVDLTVPANTTALLTLPEKTDTLTLGSGSYHYEYDTDTRLEQDRYTMETPLHTVLEHPAARAMLAQYAPEMLNNPMLEYVINEPISALLAYSPDAKPLFEGVLLAMNNAEKENG
ncbi:MAG TPA: glycoside hydrolase family 78 protein [Candidatus Gemmiger excrementavium]|uniref:alpha-L-rhamnosidase n=1 Tax=Candidatus Gemmiger excrementavium TaxID=2838608 RepID=A0A9D2F4J0_9FIRM|nr:glycoside hydrolase family 78 protein [Candidatus Gemmiger excrementavium]